MNARIIRITQMTRQQRFWRDARMTRERTKRGYEASLEITIRLGELDYEASVVGLLLMSGQDGGTSCVLEDFPDALASPC